MESSNGWALFSFLIPASCYSSVQLYNDKGKQHYYKMEAMIFAKVRAPSPSTRHESPPDLFSWQRSFPFYRVKALEMCNKAAIISWLQGRVSMLSVYPPNIELYCSLDIITVQICT